jgi:hypothetical protein
MPKQNQQQPRQQDLNPPNTGQRAQQSLSYKLFGNGTKVVVDKNYQYGGHHFGILAPTGR